MSGTNDFVPFCNDNTGSNLPTQSAYLANPALPIGNQPGVASSSLNNKALRQGTTMAAVLAQTVTNIMNVSMADNQNSNDHVIPVALQKALEACMRPLSPVLTAFLSGSGTYNLIYKAFIATPSVSPTVGATYSDGTTTFTVTDTYVGVDLHLQGGAAPVSTAGTLTKLSGTGDATITYYAYRAPVYLRVRMAGGGGSGGEGSTGGVGNNGVASTFGTSFLLCNPGTGGGDGGSGAGVGGTATVTGTAPGIVIQGGSGSGGGTNAGNFLGGGGGGSNPLGGAGGGAQGNQTAIAASANSGAGGGGGSSSAGGATPSGQGGGSGGYLDVIITAINLLASYAYAVGAGGAQKGSGIALGAAGGSGYLDVTSYYQ